MQDTSNTYTNSPQKGLVTDLHENLVSKELWTFARNAQTNSHLGQIQFLQNEPSNYKCVDLPNTPIGFIKLLNNRWVVFTTDNNSNDEIGIFDESKCTYQKLVKDSCLNLNTSHLIQGVSKEMYDCTETIYWTDANNQRRYLNISNVPYKYSLESDDCETKDYNTKLDCDALLIDKNSSVPCITSKLGSGGNLKNGVYQFSIAYTINKSRVTDFYSTTRPQAIWTHDNMGQSIELTIDDLDREFDQYELVMIYTIDNVTRYKTIGYFSTAVKKHHISSVERSDYEEITLADIIITRPKYPYADLVVSNDQYLLFAGVTTTPELNYQLQAFDIKAQYMVYRVPADYYQKGGQLVGYNRDEVYPFAIQWLFSSGEWTSAFHIPGRIAQGDNSFANGSDAFEITSDSCDNYSPKKWEVQNTADDMIPINGTINCDEALIGSGDMAYVESTELYPDNVEMFGENACTPIRHHKFPDNCKTHIYSEAGSYINILGISFSNITYPVDSNGNKIPNIVGYRIVRGNREGNRTVLAKGIATNIRSYKDEGGIEVLYPNYPYNDLRVDTFLSSKQVTVTNTGKEKNYSGLKDYKTDKFSFYSPHTLFSHVSLGDEFNFLTEEYATITGKFEKVWKHPKGKLLTNFDLYFALIIGAIDGFLSTRGKRCVTTVNKYDPTKNDYSLETKASGLIPEIQVTTPAGPGTVTPGQPLNLTVGAFGIDDNTVKEQYCDDVISQLNGVIASRKVSADKVLASVLKGLAAAGIFAYYAANTAMKTLEVISQFSAPQDYALQFNSHGFFNSYACIQDSNKRRGIDYYQYIYDGINTVDSFKMNSFKRADSVYLRLSSDVKEPQTKDESRNTIGDLGLCSNIFAPVAKNATVYYTSVKRKLPDQYGSLEGVEYLDTGHCVQNLIPKSDGTFTTDVIFGGDTFISKFAIKDTFNYFSQYLYNVPDDYIYDYEIYRNVAYPRYWINTIPYDLSEIVVPKPSKSMLPTGKHNLDCQGNNEFSGVTVVKDRYFYISNNSVKEFFVESDYNLDNRDWKYDKPSFYSRYNTDLSTLFRSGEDIEKREEFVYDNTYSKQLIENSILQQRVDYSPSIDSTCFQYLKNRVIYSLPAFKDQKGDNWQINLANNYYDFPLAEFGSLTGMHGVDNQQVIFLFDKSSPYITVGRDELQLDGSGKTITLGDGGLFAREPRPIAYTDYYYGNSQSKWAFVNTQFGSFYPSQRQGRLFDYIGKLDEISRNGMHYWFQNYMPSKLLEQFPNFKDIDNPVVGTGLLSVFDNTEERYYLSKRDYVVRDEYKDIITYDEDKNVFKQNSIKISLDNDKYFEDASWTISYSPKDQSFVSWHDWHPDWTLQTERHFMTVRNKAIWKHNDSYNSFCNFYGTQYPFSIEYLINNGQNVEVLRSLEYQLEAGKYYNNGRDFQPILDENFDLLTVYNSEQISGYLKMVIQSKNDLSSLFNYPKVDSANNVITILYNKEEQKYRVNQFWDITNDRGEFSLFNTPLWISQSNGYIKDINPKAVDYNKKNSEQKKFRNVWQKVLLTKTDPSDKKFIFKFANAKQVNSPR